MLPDKAAVSVGEGDSHDPSPTPAWVEFNPKAVFRHRKQVLGDLEAPRPTLRGAEYSNPLVHTPKGPKGGVDNQRSTSARDMAFGDPLQGFAPQNPSLDAKRKRPRQLERPLATGRIRETGASAYRKGGK